MLPEKNRKEWSALVSDQHEVDIQSFSLKMKVNNLRKAYSNNSIGIKEAVDDLYSTCAKYEKLYKTDLEKIFK